MVEMPHAPRIDPSVMLQDRASCVTAIVIMRVLRGRMNEGRRGSLGELD
jgi:hypothetical protein